MASTKDNSTRNSLTIMDLQTQVVSLAELFGAHIACTLGLRHSYCSPPPVQLSPVLCAPVVTLVHAASALAWTNVTTGAHLCHCFNFVDVRLSATHHLPISE